MLINDAPPQSSSSTRRAQDILDDMRRKREQLMTKSPSFRTCHSDSHNSHNDSSSHARPPTIPKSKSVVLSCSSIESSPTRGAHEILGDLKQKRASLTAVLEACKKNTTGAGSGSCSGTNKRRDRSIGLSTAPTAASTTSMLSSISGDLENDHLHGDDDNSCIDFSKTSQYIIDTEESDLNSISTHEELQQAVVDVCNVVLPRVLRAIQKNNHSKIKTHSSSNSSHHSRTSDRNTLTRTTTTTSWTFQSQSSARDLYRESSQKQSRSETKKRRNKISDRKRDEPIQEYETTGMHSTSTIDIQQVQSQRSHLQRMLESISELKESTDCASVTCDKVTDVNLQSSNHRHHPSKNGHRRPRQEDSSEGLTPMAKQSSRRSSSKQFSSSSSLSSVAASISSKHDDPSVASLKKKTKKKKRTDGSSSTLIASQYVLQASNRDESMKKTKRKDKKTLLVATEHIPTERSANLLPTLESDEDTLLVSPPPSDHGDDDRKRVVRSESHHKVKNTSSHPSSSSDAIHSQKSREGYQQRQENRSNDNGIDAVPPTTQGKPRVLDVEHNIPHRMTIHDDDKVVYTYDDIVREMNRLAEKLSERGGVRHNNGRTIPIGTELKLRQDKSQRRKPLSSSSDVSFSPFTSNDDQSMTGWTFSEQCDVSECTMTCLPSPVQRARIDDGSAAAGPGGYHPMTNTHDGTITRLRPEHSGTAERFCGGLYHLAVLSGMSYDNEETEV